MACGGVDVAQDVPVGGPVVEVAPALGVMFGERVVEDLSAGPGIQREAVAGLQPLLVQRVQTVEGGVQDAQLPGPVALYGGGGQVRELRLGGGQQVPGAGADGFERRGGVGVALAGAQTVGVLVVGPAVEAGVLLGVGVPGAEDLLAVVEESVEVVQEIAVSGGIEGDGEIPCRGSAVRGRTGGAGLHRGWRGLRLLAAGGAGLGAQGVEAGGVRLDDLLRRKWARLLHDAVVGGALIHAALERGGVGERGDEGVDQVSGGAAVEPGVPDPGAYRGAVSRLAGIDVPARQCVLTVAPQFYVAHPVG